MKRPTASLRWEDGKLILEAPMVLRVPVDFETLTPKLILASVKLTRREQQVLEGVAKGRANKEIGEQVHLSERTVKFHVSNLLKKFKVPTRYELRAIMNEGRNEKVGDLAAGDVGSGD